jgi:hypothetical protein
MSTDERDGDHPVGEHGSPSNGTLRTRRARSSAGIRAEVLILRPLTVAGEADDTACITTPRRGDGEQKSWNGTGGARKRLQAP